MRRDTDMAVAPTDRLRQQLEVSEMALTRAKLPLQTRIYTYRHDVPYAELVFGNWRARLYHGQRC